jgi:isopentenyl-diphosphate delta-isomerase type 1
MSKITGNIIETAADSQEEYFSLVDEKGNFTGKASRKFCHNGSKVLHAVVHIHIFNSQNKLLLQKRRMDKDIQPGKWDTSVGGHVQAGESITDAVKRETLEEAGVVIQMNGLKPIKEYIFESDVEREYVYSHIYRYDGEIKFQESEIDKVEFLDKNGIEKLIDAKETTFNFIKEFGILKELGLI